MLSAIASTFPHLPLLSLPTSFPQMALKVPLWSKTGDDELSVKLKSWRRTCKAQKRIPMYAVNDGSSTLKIGNSEIQFFPNAQAPSSDVGTLAQSVDLVLIVSDKTPRVPLSNVTKDLIEERPTAFYGNPRDNQRMWDDYLETHTEEGDQLYVTCNPVSVGHAHVLPLYFSTPRFYM